MSEQQTPGATAGQQMAAPMTTGGPPAAPGSWIVFAGVALAVVGGIIMGVAHSKLQSATRVNDLTNAMLGLSYLDDTSAAMRTATSWGHFGLGALIFGLALFLCGVMVVALRRPVQGS